MNGSTAATRAPEARAPRLPQLELDCIKVLWQAGDCSVAQVRAKLARPLAYTTVMTVLDRMASKGLVTRRKQGRAYVYSAQLDLDAARATAVRRLLLNLFDNDRTALLQYVAGIEHIDTEAGRRPQRTRSVRRPAAIPALHPSIDDSLL